MKTAKNGDLLIIVNGRSESANRVKGKVAKSIGLDARIRKMDDLTPIEIRDLEDGVTKEEVLETALNDKEVGAKLIGFVGQPPELLWEI